MAFFVDATLDFSAFVVGGSRAAVAYTEVEIRMHIVRGVRLTRDVLLMGFQRCKVRQLLF